MLAKLTGGALHGVDAIPITVEVSVSKGLGCQVTGLADDSIKESLSRIAIAIHHAGFHLPRTKLLIHLSPAHVRKSGTAYDLPILLGILIASGQLHDIGKAKDYVFAGEVSLDGSILPVRGALCMSEMTQRKNLKGIVLPAGNAPEAAMFSNVRVYAVRHLREVLHFLSADCVLDPYTPPVQKMIAPASREDFKNIIGQQHAKRAMEIAAAGGHHIVLSGPPGTGKSQLARCLPSILPPLCTTEKMEVTKIYSISPKIKKSPHWITERPFRTIHPTISDAGLTGGGPFALPGEITLAHNGVLFLDEFAEFSSRAIEALRQPMEERKICVSRTNAIIEYPAAFQLVAAMNPCVCGYHHHPTIKCICSKRALYWYRRKISGPMLDRIDLLIEMLPVAPEEMYSEGLAESSSVIRKRVVKAWSLQQSRYNGHPSTHCNAHMSIEQVHQYCTLGEYERKYFNKCLQNGMISMRAMHKILKLARTIADLAGTTDIDLAHLGEAIHFSTTEKTTHHEHHYV